MPVGWVMMSKHLALPGQQQGSRDANEGAGSHLGPGNELMQLSVSALMSTEIMRAPNPEKQDTKGRVAPTRMRVRAQRQRAPWCWGFTQRCSPWFNAPAMGTQDQLLGLAEARSPSGGHISEQHHKHWPKALRGARGKRCLRALSVMPSRKAAPAEHPSSPQGLQCPQNPQQAF